ncbi:hypothetical protein FYC62_04965 [Pedobacter aquae]|jgi:hypothetical protein|uniref:Lipoprotein n=1 Tax=Pedobacter aquae TaxID=2605747 RepID=A0A5C0VGE1_9SPHI|nr:hypothetical protein [Pedobacter aquae]QEK51097.1 hypothetical protein FYC62_04965 [Pedobacter aquae]
MTSKIKVLSYLLIVFCVWLTACSSSDKNTVNNSELTFEDLKGIVFHEVRREFKNGLSFNEIGFQQEPEWTLAFQAQDSVDVFSPTMNKMVGFYLHHDHKSYYNFAKEWFSVISLAKDSIVLQRLEVQSLRVKNDVRSNVYMTFYADNYIKNKLKTTVAELRKPSKQDTLFVTERAKQANLHPLDSNYLFAARNPVKFTAISKNISVEKTSTFDKALSQSKSYAYLYPEYEVNISKAYKEFNFAFRVIVETSGKLTVYDFPTFDEDTEKAQRKVFQGILDVYLANMLKIEPGNTLGIKHASLVTLYVKGKIE